MDKVYFIRNHSVHQGELLGYTKKGSYRILFNNKETIVSCLKAFKTFDEAKKELGKLNKIRKRKQQKEFEFDKKIQREVNILDLMVRNYKMYNRKQVSEEEFNKLNEEYEIKLNEVRKKYEE